MSVLMRRENTLIIEPGSDISKIQIINFILLPNSKKHFEGPPLQQLWYISTTGVIYKEKIDSRGWTIYDVDFTDGIPQTDVKQIISGGDLANGGLIFVLTKTGIFVKGTCDITDTFVCGQTQTSPHPTFDPVVITPIDATKIDYLELSTNFDYLFIYIGADVYALGNNIKGQLAVADNLYQRFVGTGITRVAVGWDMVKARQAAYFLMNNNLFIYDPDTVEKNVLVLDNVLDFIILGYNYQQQDILCVRDQSIVDLSEDITMSTNGTDLYCSLVPTDIRCDYQLKNQPHQCYDGSNNLQAFPFCHVYDCANHNSNPVQAICNVNDCSGAQSTNASCWAALCLNTPAQTRMFIPACYFDFAHYAYETNLTNAKDYIFINNLLYQFQDSLNPFLLLSGAAAGIAVAICFIVFGLIFCCSFISYKKRIMRTYQPTIVSTQQTLMMPTQVHMNQTNQIQQPSGMLQ
ncbi:Hypothetical_protein [Hexamita inflata]|uniref:Hypothetical_protein n=1 Tax=Hexamita inflata TaxID=28002 RepID=A0AA86P0Q4_9EUKA|nr:Hypothetical protein HINF_LOCUS16076 [Hexamita inflata]CAI9954876.1 Hypothetical protein HINF_LOCUS42521 [Hexamita inflata]